MLTSLTTETMMRERQRRLLDAAVDYRLAREVRSVCPAPVRARAGWLLVRAGLHLAQARQPSSASLLGHTLHG